MSDTLRERVARLVCSSWDGGRICSEMCVTCCNTADAAIALVLEEAARVAQCFPARTHGNLDTAPYADAEQAAEEIAAAIRALKAA